MRHISPISDPDDTIVAPATAEGGALCVIRICGADAVGIADSMFRGRRPLREAATHTLHYGRIVDTNGRTIDDVVVAMMLAPHSYTGDDTIEISAHGSRYIVSEIIRLAIAAGARMASPGEFTARAFLAGRLDLSQAEAVADTIAADSQWSLAIASTQMRGGYSELLAGLRTRLLHLTSLLELELDFSEEDVVFADRKQLREILDEVQRQTRSLIDSFALGNALKNGVAVAIAGRPNVGKSTLLNRLCGDDRAMVSDIAGTTRDTVEAETRIDGVLFRFIDTAGLRNTDDRLERMGIERTHEAIDKAHIVLHLTTPDHDDEHIDAAADRRVIKVLNKIDLLREDAQQNSYSAAEPHAASETRSHADCRNDATAAASRNDGIVRISAKCGDGIDELRRRLRATVDTDRLSEGSVTVSNMRHYEALRRADEALSRAVTALDDNLPTELLSEEIRDILRPLGEITGEITSDDILASIFSKFCIGK